MMKKWATFKFFLKGRGRQVVVVCTEFQWQRISNDDANAKFENYGRFQTFSNKGSTTTTATALTPIAGA